MFKTNPLFHKYNPRLDGLRAIAVLLVIFYHYRVPGFEGGGYGVDLFFVLSGLLITLVLIKGKEKGESLFVFYWRRFLRLMPALALMCISFLIFSLFFSDMVPIKMAALDIFASIFYVSNWTRAFTVGTPVIPVVLGNTWSLAIEEQFYLIWPLLFMLLSSKKVGKYIVQITIGILVASIIWSIYAALNNYGDSRVYNGFDTHCFALLMGCSMALLSQSINGEKVLIGASKIWPLAIIGLIYTVGFMKIQTNGTTYYSLMFAILSIFLILSTYYDPKSILGKFLELKPMVAIGKISYGLYLWHYPIWLILFTFRLPWSAVTFIGIPLSFAAAAISYNLVEKKLLKFRDSTTLPLQNLGKVTVSVSVTGMMIAGIYFLYEPIKAIMFPVPVIIQTYSPQIMRVGETINFQTDGQSYFVLATEQKLPVETKLQINKQKYEVYLQNNIIATPLSKELLSKVGKNEVVLISNVGVSLAPPVFFEVVGK